MFDPTFRQSLLSRAIILGHIRKTLHRRIRTIAQLHRDYKEECEKQGKPFASLTMYRNIFKHEFNIAFFIPKKDQCQACVSDENLTEEKKKLEEEHNTHIEEKILSRDEKENDKRRTSSSYEVACFDLQASLPTPNRQVCSIYYRSKISAYNVTVSDLTSKGQGSVNCYMWHKGQGKRGAVEIDSFLLYYLQEKAAVCNTEDLEIVFYSDNCTGPQKTNSSLQFTFMPWLIIKLRQLLINTLLLDTPKMMAIMPIP